ncbi:MAG TPA: polyhydroxyalkanoate depolymerase [Acetobacteraceae bacterium]|nr:polyhydroxyalkanoate depolymerase [Acetobacteraceae bacterium]
MLLYQLYQSQADLLSPFRRAAAAWLDIFGTHPGIGRVPPARLTAAAAELFATSTVTHQRPDFGIESVLVGNDLVPVREVPELVTPFGTLLHFEKEGMKPQPKVLLVAPMSGHFATLLRATVITMLPDCDIYITDWHNARDVPLAAGRFGFDEYVEHLMQFLRHLGPPTHLLAVCQPAVPALVATSLMSARKDVATPHTLTLMAGPIDTRVSPTRVNIIAQQRSLAEYEHTVITTVPWRFKGGGRRVYPGFMQLLSFMSMNADRHINAHLAQLRRLFAGDMEGAAAHRKFYDEYFAVADLPAEFYLETVSRVFQEHVLPRGEMTWRGEKVDCAAISRTSLLVVEGERDDICGVGQTMAALELCTRIPTVRKSYHLQTGAGHYGVFSGRAWSGQIYPKVRAMIGAA